MYNGTTCRAGETDATLAAYSDSVLRLLSIKDTLHDAVSCHQANLESPHTLPDADIKHLPTWRYQESKEVVWIESGWKKWKEGCIDAPPF